MSRSLFSSQRINALKILINFIAKQSHAHVHRHVEGHVIYFVSKLYEMLYTARAITNDTDVRVAPRKTSITHRVCYKDPGEGYGTIVETAANGNPSQRLPDNRVVLCVLRLPL